MLPTERADAEFYYKANRNPFFPRMSSAFLLIPLALLGVFFPIFCAIIGERYNIGVQFPKIELFNPDLANSILWTGILVAIFGAGLFLTASLVAWIKYLWLRLNGGEPRLKWVPYSRKVILLQAYDPHAQFSKSELIAYQIVPSALAMMLIGATCMLIPAYMLIASPASMFIMMAFPAHITCVIWTFKNPAGTIYSETFRSIGKDGMLIKAWMPQAIDIP